MLGQKNDIRQNEKDKTCVVIKCLHGLIWNWIFRDGSLFSWIGNFFRLPQGFVDIPGICLRFDGIILFYVKLWKQDFCSLTFAQMRRAVEIFDCKNAVR